jgi:hypothetical protein
MFFGFFSDDGYRHITDRSWRARAKLMVLTEVSNRPAAAPDLEQPKPIPPRATTAAKVIAPLPPQSLPPASAAALPPSPSNPTEPSTSPLDALSRLDPEQFPPAPPLLDGDRFYFLDELGTSAQPLQALEPVLEDILDPQQLRTVLELWIDADGKLVRAVWLEGQSTLPADEALARLKTWRFQPALREDVPIPSIKVIEISLSTQTAPLQ